MARRTRTIILAVGVLTLATAALVAGPLNPPAGPVASTYKTLTEVEPRIAINSTNTPGDGVTVYKITQPGSYYLTGNVAGVQGRYGIVIDSDNVCLDLMGFTIQGAVGSLDGIRTSSTWRNNIKIRNGHVNGFGAAGVNFYVNGAEQNITIENVSASSNGTYGLRAGSSARFSHCTVWSNGSTGISSISDAVIDHCVVRANNAGINVGQGSSITDCSVYDNTGVGISVVTGSVIRGCAVYSNNLGGIFASGSTVTDCTCASNQEYGISASTRCVIRNNLCTSNTNVTGDAAGILCTGTDNRVEGNSCASNSRGVRITSAGCVVQQNTCSGNTTNWDIAIGNAVDRKSVV